MKKKLLGLLLGTVLATTAIAGCGSNSGAGDQTGSDSPNTDDQKDADNVEEGEQKDTDDIDGGNAEYKTEVMGMELTNLSLDGTLADKYAGQKITVATCEGDFASGLATQIEVFEEITGANVELNTFPGDSYMEKIQMDLNAGGTFDVVLMPIANIHGYATTGLVADMTPMLNDWASESYDESDFLTGLFDTYARYDGKIVALPYKPDIILNFYRTDLFEDEDLKAKFQDMYGYELTAPNNDTELDEYLDICKFFTKKFNSDSPTTYGYCANAGTGNLRWIWQNRLPAYGGNIVDENFETQFNNDAGVSAMEYLLQLAECAPENWEEFDWESANAMFCSGDVAMMEQWPGLYATTQSEGSEVIDKVGASVTAGGTPVLGGWALAIADKSDNQELAFKFCEFCTSKDGEILKLENTMDPCRTSNYEREGVIAYNPLYPAFIDCLPKGASIADVDVPIVTSELNSVLELGCHYALTGEKEIKESLDWMQAEFDSAIEDAGLK